MCHARKRSIRNTWVWKLYRSFPLTNLFCSALTLGVHLLPCKTPRKRPMAFPWPMAASFRGLKSRMPTRSTSSGKRSPWRSLVKSPIWVPGVHSLTKTPKATTSRSFICIRRFVTCRSRWGCKASESAHERWSVGSVPATISHARSHFVLGNGKPLFKGLHDQLHLKLLKTKTFRSGYVLLDYQPIGKEEKK